MKFTKVFTFIVAAALTMGIALAFSAGAETATDSELAIVGKNIVYNDTLTIRYAVPTSKISANAKLFIESDDVSDSVGYFETQTTDKITGTEDTYYIFEVTGIPASAVCKEIVVHIEDGEKIGPELKYSLAEYFYERLYADGVVNATDGKALYQKKLYLSYLEYAANAQDLFNNFEQGLNETLVTNRFYLNVDGGAVGGLGAGVYEPGSKVTITPKDSATKAWKLTKYSFVDGILNTETKTVAAGAEIELTANTLVAPGEIIPGLYAEVYPSLAYDDRTTARSLAVDGFVYGCNRNDSAKHSLAGYMLYDQTTFPTTTDRAFENITADPENAANKILKYSTYDLKDTTPIIFTNYKSDMKTGNCLVFETKIRLTGVIDGVTNYAGTSTPHVLTIGACKTNETAEGSGKYYNTSEMGTAYISAIDNGDGTYSFCLTSYDFINTIGKGGEISASEWHTITVELYDNGKALYYVDGVRILSKTIKDGGVDLDAAYNSWYVEPRGNMTNGFGAYFDNTFVGFIDKDYVAN